VESVKLGAAVGDRRSVPLSGVPPVGTGLDVARKTL
jgi:hypothetical protein